MRSPDQAGGSRSPRALTVVVGVLSVSLVAGGVIMVRTFSGGSNRTASARPIVPKDPDAVAKILAAAQTYENQGDYTKAATILQRASEEHALDAQVRISYARALVGQQKYPEAYAEYQAALALGGSGGNGGGAGHPEDAKLHFEAGTIANKAGLFGRAEEHYSMAQSADPADPKYPLYLAMMQLKQGHDDSATASLVRAVKLDPDMAEAWGTLAELALKQNYLDLAAQHIEKARKLQPDVVRWRLDEAKVLKRQASKESVEKAAGLLLAMDKSEQMKPEVMTVLAECYGLLHRPSDAAAMYAEAVKVHPRDAEAAYQAALWFERAGDRAEAARYAAAAAGLGHAGAAELMKDLPGQK